MSKNSVLLLIAALPTALFGSMTPISTWNDVAPFADKVVLFTGHSVPLDAYIVTFDGSPYRVGHVSKSSVSFPSNGYSMRQLLVKNAQPQSITFLSTENIATWQPMAMRLPTTSELETINSLINSGQAEFALDPSKESATTLAKQ